MDLHMPVKDGAETLSELRQAEYEIPVLMLTADVQEQKHQMLQQLGCQQVLTKPVTEVQLLLALATHLEKHRVTAPVLSEIKPSLPDTETFAYDELQISYLQSLPPLQQKIENYWQQQDWPALELELDKIKGTAACLDFLDMSEAAAEAGRAVKQSTDGATALTHLLQLLQYYQSQVETVQSVQS